MSINRRKMLLRSLPRGLPASSNIFLYSVGERCHRLQETESDDDDIISSSSELVARSRKRSMFSLIDVSFSM